jgi:chorismate mutase
MPTSPTSPDLIELREALEQLNQQWFGLLQERRELVAKIQATKRDQSLPVFDHAREAALFRNSLQLLAPLHIKELLAFSLLIEAHAGSPERYPAWSEGVHLSELPLKDFHRINPVLLKCIHPDLFKTLQIAPDFAFLRDS